MLTVDSRRQDARHEILQKLPEATANGQRSNFLAARPTASSAFHVGLLLVPGFALMSFASVIEPARGANRMSGKPLYDWTLYSARGGEVVSNSGIGCRPIR